MVLIAVGMGGKVILDQANGIYTSIIALIKIGASLTALKVINKSSQRYDWVTCSLKDAFGKA